MQVIVEDQQVVLKLEVTDQAAATAQAAAQQAASAAGEVINIRDAVASDREAVELARADVEEKQGLASQAVVDARSEADRAEQAASEIDLSDYATKSEAEFRETVLMNIAMEQGSISNSGVPTEPGNTPHPIRIRSEEIIDARNLVDIETDLGFSSLVAEYGQSGWIKNHTFVPGKYRLPLTSETTGIRVIVSRSPSGNIEPDVNTGLVVTLLDRKVVASNLDDYAKKEAINGLATKEDAEFKATATDELEMEQGVINSTGSFSILTYRISSKNYIDTRGVGRIRIILNEFENLVSKLVEYDLNGNIVNYPDEYVSGSRTVSLTENCEKARIIVSYSPAKTITPETNTGLEIFILEEKISRSDMLEYTGRFLLSDDFGRITIPSYNLIDKKALHGGYFNDSGNVLNTVNTIRTELIPIEGGIFYTFTPNRTLSGVVTNRFTWFNEFGEFLNGTEKIPGSFHTIQAPVDAHFLGINIGTIAGIGHGDVTDNELSNEAMLVVGTEIKEYRGFNKLLIDPSALPNRFESRILLPTTFYEPITTEAFNVSNQNQDYLKDYTKLIQLWDDLTDAFVQNPHMPAYITKEEIGTSTAGSPIFMYNFKPLNPLKKILLIGGTHAIEKLYIKLLYDFIKDMLNNWNQDPILNFLRWNIEFSVIPCRCPDSIISEIGSNGLRQVPETERIPITWDRSGTTVTITFDPGQFPEGDGFLSGDNYFSAVPSDQLIGKCGVTIFSSSDTNALPNRSAIITNVINGYTISVEVEDASGSISGTGLLQVLTDPNRNFQIPELSTWGDYNSVTSQSLYAFMSNKGTQPFSLNESRVLKQLMDERYFDFIVDNHAPAGDHHLRWDSRAIPQNFNYILDNLKKISGAFVSSDFHLLIPFPTTTPLPSAYYAVAKGRGFYTVEWGSGGLYADETQVRDAYRWLVLCITELIKA